MVLGMAPRTSPTPHPLSPDLPAGSCPLLALGLQLLGLVRGREVCLGTSGGVGLKEGSQEKVWPAEHSHTSPPSWPPGPRRPGTKLHCRLWAWDKSTRYCRPLGGKGSGPGGVGEQWSWALTQKTTFRQLCPPKPQCSFSSFRAQTLRPETLLPSPEVPKRLSPNSIPLPTSFRASSQLSQGGSLWVPPIPLPVPSGSSSAILYLPAQRTQPEVYLQREKLQVRSEPRRPSPSALGHTLKGPGLVTPLRWGHKEGQDPGRPQITHPAKVRT